jgi:hypothetical protein
MARSVRREGVPRGDGARQFIVASVGDDDFLMWPQNDGSRIPRQRLTIDEHPQPLAIMGAIAADTGGGEANAPNIKKLPEREGLSRGGLYVDDARIIMGMDGRDEPFKGIDANPRGYGGRPPPDKDVQMLMEVKRCTFFGQCRQSNHPQPRTQRAALGWPWRLRTLHPW